MFELKKAKGTHFVLSFIEWRLKGGGGGGGGRCDISAELTSISFCRPKFNVDFENHG